jgi:hypothetical protein
MSSVEILKTTLCLGLNAAILDKSKSNPLLLPTEAILMWFFVSCVVSPYVLRFFLMWRATWSRSIVAEPHHSDAAKLATVFSKLYMSFRGQEKNLCGPGFETVHYKISLSIRQLKGFNIR